MVTFYANPNNTNEPWIERAGLEGHPFRIWHYIFFCFSAFAVLVILICCCVKIRIPRTKQEIEADYRRKKLAQKFRQRLKLIENQDMDALDLQRALEIIQDDYIREEENINRQYLSPASFDIGQEPPQSFGRTFLNILRLTKIVTHK